MAPWLGLARRAEEGGKRGGRLAWLPLLPRGVVRPLPEPGGGEAPSGLSLKRTCSGEGRRNKISDEWQVLGPACKGTGGSGGSGGSEGR